MEVAVAVVSAVTRSVMPKLINALEKWWNQLKDQEQDILFLDKHLGMICASIEDQLTHNGQLSAVETISMEDFCDLAQQIEDCLDRFLPCSACQGEKIHDPKKFCAEIARLRQVLKDAFERRLSHNVVPNPNRAFLGAGSNAGTAGEDMGTNGASPEVGMEEPKKELREMLVGGEASKLKVVSIVGFGGSGKTALARAVFNCPAIASHFPRRAWAVASKHKQDALGLLTDILGGLRVQQTQTMLHDELGDEAQAMPQKLEELQQHITHLLEAKRCLIVIDDIKTELWDEITCIIPDKKTESRILVTAAVTSVATSCSFDGGYVYSMRSLSVKHSKDYLDKKVFVSGSSPDLERGSTAIVNKCDGHPLALASIAKALQGHKVLTGDLCEEITRNLCSEIDKNKNGHFTKLGQVLINNYRSLPGSSLKTCLLYTSLFPNNRPVSRKTLTSRWLAEGYIKAKTGRSDQESADENFKELIDRNIIQPIDASHSGKEKACKPHGIVHQFMLYKSISSNFIATSSDAKGTNFRHLLVDNRTSGTDSSGQTDNFLTSWKYFFKRSACEHLRPRSVTVIGNAGEAVYSDLTNCKLLKVLDLQESNDFQMQHLQKIHKLLHLKYLTLGSSISNLPDEMKKLHYLETLDLRKTKVKTLPLEVISLPHLAHLFGKMKLEEVSSRKFKKFKSNLQTLAGVVIDKDSRIPELMVTMEQLRKVKIWCETNSTHKNYTMLSEAIHKFTQAGMNTPVGTRSLSLHLSDSCKNLLHNHQGDNRNATSIKPGYLTSLKLQGCLSQFHQFVMSLSGLAELCLTYTNLKGADLLAGLRHLKLLVCLKLVEDNLADLEINLGDFPSLQRLCLVVENPIFPTIKHGALQRLVSLQLLCGDLVGLCDNVKLEWFEDLQEVALDSMVKQETIKLWEDETKKHPKRPRVLLLNRVVDPDDTGSVAKYVASCQVNNNCYTDTCTIDDMEIDLNELTLQPEPERTRTGPKYCRSDQFIIGNKRSRSPHSPERI